MLRPLDLMQPYRLEMESVWKTTRRRIYKFWGAESPKR
ncbi:peroxide stress protein YaaA [Shigella flexneri]